MMPKALRNDTRCGRGGEKRKGNEENGNGRGTEAGKSCYFAVVQALTR